MATVDGLTVEVADLPGDRARRAPRAPARGSRLGGAVARLPAGPARGDRPACDRLLALRARPLGPAARARARPRSSTRRRSTCCPRCWPQLDAPEPLLVGHSDGGSIALVHAAQHAVSGLALMAPHVVVEDVSLEAIRATRREFEQGELRARMARHHDDPDAAFRGWCDVWLDPAFRAWSLEPDAQAVSAPTLLIQGADDPYGSLDQLDRIEARVRGPVRGSWSRAGTARTSSSPRPWWRRSRSSRRACPSRRSPSSLDDAGQRRVPPRQTRRGRADQRSPPSAASVRSLKRCTLPLGVRGSSSTKCTTCGYS